MHIKEDDIFNVEDIFVVLHQWDRHIEGTIYIFNWLNAPAIQCVIRKEFQKHINLNWKYKKASRQKKKRLPWVFRRHYYGVSLSFRKYFSVEKTNYLFSLCVSYLAYWIDMPKKKWREIADNFWNKFVTQKRHIFNWMILLQCFRL